MAALFKEIRVTVSQEAQIVKAVFPHPSSVMQVFLQRVFAQVVSYPQRVCSTAHDRSNNTSRRWYPVRKPFRRWPSCVSSTWLMQCAAICWKSSRRTTRSLLRLWLDRLERDQALGH
jgi:hypothetical protein